MKRFSTRYRSTEKEILDEIDLEKKDLREVFSDLDRVNRVLGGNQITLSGLQKLLRNSLWQEPLKILDVGCGNGSMLRNVALWGRQRNIRMELLGVDLNATAIEIAREQSSDFPEISFRVMDVLSTRFSEWNFDVILCTLTLHHFRDEEIFEFLERLSDKARIGLVINDLERNKAAYFLFRVFSALFLKNRISRSDGLTSILRSFRLEDLDGYASRLRVNKNEINWKWAFRYQWIIFK